MVSIAYLPPIRQVIALKVSVLGGGFGIYGYLPAACSLGWKVTTLSRYRQAILERPELSPYLESVRFVESESDLYGFGSALVFARTPTLQFDYIFSQLNLTNQISHYYLEKPLADSNTKAQLALEQLSKSRKSFSVGYLFQYTNWFMDLESICANQGNRIVFNWRIPATHSDWKNSHVTGGGLYGFFLVHFVPILTRLGFSISDLKTSYKNEKCTLKVEGTNYIEINAQIVTENFNFELLINNKFEPLFQAQTPFGFKPQKGIPDPRIPTLKKYLVGALDGSISSDSRLKTERDVIDFLNLCVEKDLI